MRVFLDANILFSASFPKSHLSNFLLQLQNHATLLTNAYAETEAERNVVAKMPHCLAAYRAFVASLESLPVRIFELKVDLAEKDRPILCGAIAGEADFLLTGDKKDFGHLFGSTVQGVTILTVQMLLDELVRKDLIS